MKFLTVRDLRTAPGKVWKALPKEQEMILTNNGKPIALITPLNESDLEETLKAVRTARAKVAVGRMQLDSIENGNSQMTADEIEFEVRATRKQS